MEQGQTPRLLTIVPAYNEAASIAGVIDQIRDQLPRADILVVNDGSTDQTGQIARDKGVDVLDLSLNSGIGATMQAGYMFARDRDYDIAIQIDGDGQHPADSAAAVVAAVAAGEADVAVGSRFLEELGYRPPFARRIGITLFSWYISLLVRQKTTDPTSGLRAANRKAIGFFAANYPADYPEPETAVTLRRHRFRVVEVPVKMEERQGGESSISLTTGLFYVVKVALAIFIGLFREVTGQHER